MSNENQEVVTMTFKKHSLATVTKLQLFGWFSWGMHSIFMVLGLAMIVGLLHVFGFIDASNFYEAICRLCGR